jgi:hypothetical protein
MHANERKNQPDKRVVARCRVVTRVSNDKSEFTSCRCHWHL